MGHILKWAFVPGRGAMDSLPSQILNVSGLCKTTIYSLFKANKMIKLDPIIAVKDVEASTKWYEQIFGIKKAHGGKDFAVLVSENDDIILCLHKWGEHEHPSLTDPTITAGNGLILYFRTDKMEAIKKNIDNAGSILEEDIYLNPNSLKREFSVKDPNGYFLTITEYHTYKT